MSAVSPGALVIFCLRYLPRPSCVMPRWTVTPRLGTSANFIVLFWPGPDRLGEVLADLVRVDVERGGELDVADVVAAEVDVHEARDALGGVGVLVVLDALHEGGRAVADADDGDADLVVLVAGRAVGARPGSVGLAHVSEFLFEKSAGNRPRPGPLVTARPGHAAHALSSRRTWKMRWKTVIDGQRRRARRRPARAARSRRATAPCANTSPIERITTRTARRGDADLALDAERLGAGARVGDHQRDEHGDDARPPPANVVAAVGEVRADGGRARCPPRVRSSVESRNAPNGVPLPDIRE